MFFAPFCGGIMNIFYLDKDPVKCAEYHADRHVVKMSVESAQILCSAYYFTGQAELSPYRLTHPNHPCCVWARESLSNWMWLRALGLALCSEYTFRYDRAHKCEGVIRGLEAPCLPDIGPTGVKYAFDGRYLVSSDPVENYRNYYWLAKSHLFSWRKRPVPYWIIEKELGLFS
jgi:hypothetical protein